MGLRAKGNEQNRTEASLRNTPLISVVIPTCNEPDIRHCLEAALSQTYPRKEIIVVDDSTDDTPNVVFEYADRGVRMVRRERNENGCCGARNRGVLEASGDIVVILNGDVTPEPDFLDRILGHYGHGADYVLTYPVVSNQATAFGRYWDTEYRVLDGNMAKEWTEAFSARREVWLAVGGIPGDFPLPFCRDWRIGVLLNTHGYEKVIDETLVVPHIAPARLGEFWRIRRARGRFAALDNYYFQEMSAVRLLVWNVGKAAWRLLRVFALVPLLLEGRRLASFSTHGNADIVPLALLRAIDWFSQSIGEMDSWMAICRLPVEQRTRNVDGVSNPEMKKCYRLALRAGGGTHQSDLVNLAIRHEGNVREKARKQEE